ncbi:cupin-like domain-containing protein [Pseudofulvibacter geojedonensis]|uniref:Cupin-like domain-containing protein n=1 Tax=Pseudofulvibacter geojedonensis TaxID=1123758 RepID=A0ABW3I3I8_9FLAO
MKLLQLEEVHRVSSISKKVFLQEYVKKQRPVVVEKFTEDWPAYLKWNFDYIKKIAGDKIVPLYDNRPVNYKEGFNEPHTQMKMSDYIDLLLSKPTNYRIFLYNLLKEVPVLQADFKFPKLGMNLFKSMPMLFFGGTNSYTFMHFDIDLANILHFHFQGKKKCIIFPPDQTKYLYKIPYSLISREDINFDDPDYQKWPALKKAKGFTAELNHGDMLYMPEGYWHYMKYITPGFSMSLRSLARNPKNVSKAIYNIFFMRYYDNFMRKLKGEDWLNTKLEKAIRYTHKINQIDY